MLTDFVTALRQLRRTPIQSTIAVATLALGIGLSVTMGSLLKALVLDPFYYPQPDRIVQVWCKPGWPLSFPDYKDLRDQNTSFESFGVYTMESYNIGGGTPVFTRGALCTADVLPSLGVKPHLGRWLLSEDEQAGAANVAVISHGIWQKAFGGAGDIIGRHVPINGQDTEIIGVMPRDFEFVVAWFNLSVVDACSVWTPLKMDSKPWAAWRGSHWLVGVARLKDRVTVGAASAEFKALAMRLQQMYPDTNKDKTLTVRSLRTELTEGIPQLGLGNSGTGATNWTLFGASAFVLLLACANVACMLIAQGTARQREFSVRLALGAARWQIVRLLLLEA